MPMLAPEDRSSAKGSAGDCGGPKLQDSCRSQFAVLTTSMSMGLLTPSPQEPQKNAMRTLVLSLHRKTFARGLMPGGVTVTYLDASSDRWPDVNGVARVPAGSMWRPFARLVTMLFR